MLDKYPKCPPSPQKNENGRIIFARSATRTADQELQALPKSGNGREHFTQIEARTTVRRHAAQISYPLDQVIVNFVIGMLCVRY